MSYKKQYIPFRPTLQLLKKLSLCRLFPQTTIKHIMAILISVFSLGYHGKTSDFERYSPCHRTTVAHFLNKGKWNDAGLEGILKSTVIEFIYKEAQRTGKPVFCIVDDTISSKKSLRHGLCIRLKMRISTNPT